MATVTDPTFGGGFDADAFRSAIRSTMLMGLPNATIERATFVWRPETYYASSDSTGAPWTFKTAPDSVISKADVVSSVDLPVAVEFSPTRTSSGSTIVGDFDITKAIITVLDVDYVQLIDDDLGRPDEVLLGGNRYKIKYERPPLGLFDVTVYIFDAEAIDES